MTSVNVPRDEGFSPVYEAALTTIRKGAPGLSDDTCKVLARSINMKVSLLAAQPEAQKGEPVAWRRMGETNLYWTLFDDPKDAEFYLAQSPRLTVQPLYTHPAPASDELQVFADFIADEIHNLGLSNSKLELVKAAFRSLIGRYNAKHKGPQS